LDILLTLSITEAIFVPEATSESWPSIFGMRRNFVVLCINLNLGGKLDFDTGSFFL
jgi:hypothetical protein